MKVISRGFNPNLGEEFMQRHAGGFVLGLSAKSQTPTSSETESADPNAEEDGRVGQLRMLRMAVQNVQLEAQSKGKRLPGPMSATQILELAARGELDGIMSVASLRKIVESMGGG